MAAFQILPLVAEVTMQQAVPRAHKDTVHNGATASADGILELHHATRKVYQLVSELNFCYYLELNINFKHIVQC